MVFNKSDLIKESVIKNLLSAQERIAKNENATDNIKIAKYLFKVCEKFRNKEEHVFSETSEQGADCPPNSGENNVT